MSRLPSGLSYANVVATIALFVGLAGGAYAAAKDSIGSKEIENGAVRSKELKDDNVRGADVEAGTLQGSDIADATIGGDDVADGSLGSGEIVDGSLGGIDVGDGSIEGVDIANRTLRGVDIVQGSLDGDEIADDSLGRNEIAEEELNFADVPNAGVLSSQVRNIGGDGDTLFGPLAGRATAGSIQDVEMALPSPTFFGNLTVFLSEELDAGQSRTFTVVTQTGALGGVFETDVTCTVSSGQDRCSDTELVGVGGLLAAVRIESTGATLDPNDTAYVAIAAKAPLNQVPLP